MPRSSYSHSIWISVKLLDDVSVRKLKESFKRGSSQTLTICAPHSEQRVKKHQGDLPKAANSWNDWMKRHGLDPIQKTVGLEAAAAADKANKPSLPTTLLNCSPAPHNKHWHDRFEHNWTRNWLDLQLSDNKPGGKMKSWKFTLCNFVNHYSETWPGLHLLARRSAGLAEHHVWGVWT